MGSCRVIGLISGTSADGVDVAVAQLCADDDVLRMITLGHHTLDYPDDLRARLLAALPPANCTAAELCRLDTEIGQHFAAAANTALHDYADGRADLVASFGQTVYHWVESGQALGTLQLGQPAWIAEATGLPVLADLRVRDVAAGGHGAPLAPTLDVLWLRGAFDNTAFDHPAAALNIGGIANITVVDGIGEDGTVDGSTDGDTDTIGFDTGPGNALIDAAIDMITDGRAHYDRDGALAAAGTPRADLLDRLLADDYYATTPPKSTGKEHFNAAYLRDALDGLPAVDDADLLATLTELTAITVADACRAHRVRTVVVSGGGAANPTLLTALRRRLAPIELRTSDQLGLPIDGKEAYLAALLGFLGWHGLPANTPSATGARGPRLLGSITAGAHPLRLPTPLRRQPTRLIITPPIDTAAVSAVGGTSASD